MINNIYFSSSKTTPIYTEIEDYNYRYFNPEDICNSITLRIPRECARNNIYCFDRIEDLSYIECYEIYIFNQVGDALLTKKDTYLLLELPSGRIVNILLYHDEGVDFDPAQRKYILKEYDDIDRRIILGFCIRYKNSLKCLSHYDTLFLFNITIKIRARNFNSKQISIDLPKKNRVDDLFVDSKLFAGVNPSITSAIQLIRSAKV